MGLTFDGVNGISATGNIISSQGFISATGNIYAGNLITALSTTGNVSGTNILASGNVISSGSILAAGTMSSTGAATHSSLTLGTPLTVANGGTNGLTANNVLLGNGAGAPQVVAPGDIGNLLLSNGSTWISGANPTVLYDANISVNTVYSIALTASRRPVLVFMQAGTYQGGNTGVVVTFQWGIGNFGLNAYTPVNAGVNFVVYPQPSILTFVTPTDTTALQVRIATSGLSITAARLFVIQL